jgi:hypothetical protein
MVYLFRIIMVVENSSDLPFHACFGLGRPIPIQRTGLRVVGWLSTQSNPDPVPSSVPSRPQKPANTRGPAAPAKLPGTAAPPSPAGSSSLLPFPRPEPCRRLLPLRAFPYGLGAARPSSACAHPAAAPSAAAWPRLWSAVVCLVPIVNCRRGTLSRYRRIKSPSKSPPEYVSWFCNFVV